MYSSTGYFFNNSLCGTAISTILINDNENPTWVEKKNVIHGIPKGYKTSRIPV